MSVFLPVTGIAARHRRGLGHSVKLDEFILTNDVLKLADIFSRKRRRGAQTPLKVAQVQFLKPRSLHEFEKDRWYVHNQGGVIGLDAFDEKFRIARVGYADLGGTVDQGKSAKGETSNMKERKG